MLYFSGRPCLTSLAVINVVRIIVGDSGVCREAQTERGDLVALTALTSRAKASVKEQDNANSRCKGGPWSRIQHRVVLQPSRRSVFEPAAAEAAAPAPLA